MNGSDDKKSRKFSGILSKKVSHRQGSGKESHADIPVSNFIIENSHIGIFIINDAFKCVYANNQFANMLGYPLNEIVSNDFRNFLPKENRDHLAELYIRRQKGEVEPGRYDKEFIKADGERQTSETQVSVIETHDQQILTIVQAFDVSEHRKMKEEIEKSENKYKMLVETIQDYVFEHDLSGKFTFVNEAIVQLSGYTKSELIGMDYHEYILPEDIHIVEDFYLSIYKTGEPGSGLQYRAKWKDGVIRYYEARGILITDKQNQPTGWRSIAHDITEKKQAELELKKSEKKYRDFFQNVLDFIFIHDLEGNFLENNARYVMEMGAKPDIIAKVNLRDLIPDKFKPEFYKYLKRIRKNGRDEGVIAIQVPGGEKRVFEYKNILLHDEDKHPVSVLGSARDISDHIRDKKALRESKKRYQMIIESVGDYIFEVDLKGNYTFVNQALIKESGYTRDELIGMNFRNYTFPEEQKSIESYFYETYTSDETGKGLQHQVIRKDSSPFFIESVVSLIKNMDGKPIGFRGVSRDISEHKLSETILLKSEQQLKDIIEGSPIPTIVFDKNSHITHWNRACETLIGVGSNKVIGKHKKVAEKYLNQPILPDSIGDNVSIENLSMFFGSECRKSKIVKNAYEMELFFPKIGETGKWLFLTLAFLRDPENKIVGVIETLLDVSYQKRAEKNLLKMHDALEDKVIERTKELQEVNIALEVLLKKRENDKKKFEDKVAYSIKEVLTPHLELLKKTNLDKHQKVYLEILEENFKEIASPFMTMLSDSIQKLTRTEIQVINLIKQNKITKEIADLMGISTRTVETHRDNIRKKLGIRNKKVNLRSFLLTSE